ncbi:two component transcriptional regulator, winged helix family [Thiorhodococcus drewsii AZ1]|uniref:Two component transcriptional regulator, winged helix family n=1 Tax=Thiorhodococcus drewsii AZ1 TaxID=765913 RepID=G2DXV6_9GAMM|nr:response regulator transcription factor [Thiorhodococcus drewsii]EGV33155.1 two component transcriptional regulator, winged helix family [Thiorhodococcus drewsii AZ1]
MIQVLIVDDDPDIREIVSEEARQQGWSLIEAGSEAELRSSLESVTPDIILLDIRLPDQDGLTIARQLRATSAIPIIMLTGMGSDVDRILGLEMGADDYVVKPFNPRELTARIKAVLRRTSGELASTPHSPAPNHDYRRFAGWTLDLSARILTDSTGNPVSLTNAEYLLLEALVESPKRVLTREQLLERTHNDDAEVFDRTIDVLILRLRRKIEPNPHAPRLIRTERGAGYVFDAVVEKR